MKLTPMILCRDCGAELKYRICSSCPLGREIELILLVDPDHECAKECDDTSKTVQDDV